MSKSKSKGKSPATLTPQVNISTGVVTNGPIYINGPFQWVSASPNDVCTVSTPAAPNQQWFSPSPVTVRTPPGYAAVTAKLANPAGWSYGVTGCNVQGGNPRVPVNSGRP